MTVDDLILEARKVTGEFSLSDTEKFLTAGTVGAALVTKSGKVFTGICIDLYCGIGFCAEHSAIAEMLKHRETQIDMIVAVTEDDILPPCGRCRELMMQVDKRNSDTKVIVSGKRIKTLDELMPERWM
jgi:cytidine deaminase